MTAEAIAKALGGRRTGGGWIARCPAHDDREPSLSIADGDSSKVVVHCFALCQQDRVIVALRRRGLWGDAGQDSGKTVGAPLSAIDRPDRAIDTRAVGAAPLGRCDGRRRHLGRSLSRHPRHSHSSA
jgi:putative DNA primase/helicase